MYAMAIGLRLALFLCAGSVLLSVASAAQADDQSPPRSVSVCTPTAWQPGCTSPINLNGLVHVLDSPASSLPPLRFLTSHFVVRADDCLTNLGSWATAHGLDEPGQTVELARAASTESKLVQAWLTDLTTHPRESNVTITLVDGLGEPLESWQLTRVIPLLWSIEAFDTSSARVAIETLELNYGGLISASTC
jgi:T4-like virus tail tube protein gp19